MGIMARIIKKVADKIKKVKSDEIVTTDRQEINVITKKVAAVSKSNVGDPFLGMGVDFYPSDEIRNNMLAIGDKKFLNGEIVLLIGDGIVKVKVDELAPRIFKCKAFNDTTLSTSVDNSWRSK